MDLLFGYEPDSAWLLSVPRSLVDYPAPASPGYVTVLVAAGKNPVFAAPEYVPELVALG
jgi:hypothetical protein